jgi:antitoxin component YwqK of YwqJK toxin-antitoxin module
MKYIITILFSHCFIFGWSQDWDTVYSDNSEVEISVEISYYNCNFVHTDTVYRLNTYTTDIPNRRLFHYKTKSLIFERWVSNDTTYCFGYYPNGKIKLKDISFENDWLHHSKYYDNGQLCVGGELYKNKTYSWNRYYPNGKIMSKAFHYDYFPGRFGEYEEYYPNGKISCKELYSLPDTTNRHYQSSEFIKGEYFGYTGNKIDTTNSVINIMTTWIQPTPKTDNIQKIDSLFTHHAVYNLSGYNNNLTTLKNKIKNEIRLPKKCGCENGIAWIGFIVNKQGVIQNISVDYEHDCVKNEIVKAIEKIGKWEKAYIENDEVDLYVYTYLIIK